MPTIALRRESAVVIRATLPAVGGAIEEITTLFYATLFADHPELERDLFNRGNQAQGDQQRALAGAIASFAALMVAEDAPTPDAVLSRIANKHASLGITEELYQVVHDYLFAAIIQVLGEAVTPEVAQAWDEVYWLMANGLIAIERRLYTEAGVAPGQVWRTATVVRRVQESPDCIALTLASGDDVDLPGFAPGQYISVAVLLPDAARQIRQYSLTAVSGGGQWRITVKKDGQVSHHLHTNVFEGDVLSVSLPFGDLTLHPETVPVLMVSAGIGCTPMIGMLRHLVDSGDQRPVWVVHADRSPSMQAHRAELEELVAELPAAIMHNWYSDLGVRAETQTSRTGRTDLSDIALPDGVHAYLCGPLPFMKSMREQLIESGVPGANIHYEVFGPDHWLQVA